MTECLGKEEIVRFLSDVLSDADQQRLERHLQDCQACRKLLDRETALPASMHEALSANKRSAESNTAQPPDPLLAKLRCGPTTDGPQISCDTHNSATSTADGTRAPSGSTGRVSPIDLPGYEFLEELGRGGLGVVFKAKQLALERVVAVKMLQPHTFPSHNELARFRVEAEAVAKLQHPNVVQVFDIIDCEGIPCLCMEYVEGGDLSARTGSDPQPPRTAARLVEIVARAIHSVHETGFLHRDLKPANILLAKSSDADSGVSLTAKDGSSEWGQPKITDFGLAKQMGEDSGLTRTETALGTPSYMPPEQAREGRTATVAADVYSLGAILYKLLVGRPPFHGASAVDTLSQVIHEEPVSPTRLVKTVPADLEAVCLKCLNKDPRRRYTSAAALADDLARWIRGEPIEARPAGLFEKTVKWVRRNPVLALVWGMAVLLPLAVAIHFRTVAGVERTERAAAEDATYWATMLAAFREYRVGAFYRASEILDSSPERLRNWEWHYLRSAIDSHAWQLETPNRQIAFAAYRGKGSQMVLVDERSQVQIVDVAKAKVMKDLVLPTGKPLAISEDARFVLSVTTTDPGVKEDYRLTGPSAKFVLYEINTGEAVQEFECTTMDVSTFNRNLYAVSPGGRFVACPMHNEAPGVLFESATGEPILSYGWSWGCTFSPDGAWFIYSSADGIQFWDIASRQIARPPIADKSRNLRCSPDRSLLAGVRSDDITVWNLGAADKPVRMNVEAYTMPGSGAAFNHEGTALIAAFNSGAIHVWDARTGEVLRHVGKNHRLAGQFGQYSWNGDHFAIPASENGKNHVKVWNLGTPPAHVLGNHTGYVYPVKISADGGTIISGAWDETARVWDGETGAQRFVCGGHDTYVSDLALDDSAGRFVTVDFASTYRLWDVNSGKLLETRDFPRPEGLWPHLKHVVLTPDGKWIIGTTDRFLVRLAPANLSTKHQIALEDLLGTRDILDLEVAPSGDRVGIITRDQASATKLNVLNAASLDMITSTDVGDPVRQLEFSPSRPHVAIGFKDGSVGIWDLQDVSQPIWREAVHSNEVFGLVFSPDGTRLFSGSRDGTIGIWDARDGEVFGPLVGHEKYVYSLDISSDGRRLVSGSGDATVRIWETWPYSKRAAAMREANAQGTSR